MPDRRQLCTFVLGDQLFGIGVENVQEVLSAQSINRLPLANTALQGLINLRGQVVPVVDLRSCLGMAPRPSDQAPSNVVVRVRETAVSLWVDEIGDVLEVSAEAFEPTPATLHGVGRELIAGVYKLEGRLLLVLDILKTLQTASA